MNALCRLLQLFTGHTIVLTSYLLSYILILFMKGSTLKGKKFLPREQILSLCSRPFLTREAKTFLTVASHLSVFISVKPQPHISIIIVSHSSCTDLHNTANITRTTPSISPPIPAPRPANKSQQYKHEIINTFLHVDSSQAGSNLNRALLGNQNCLVTT